MKPRIHLVQSLAAAALAWAASGPLPLRAAPPPPAAKPEAKPAVSSFVIPANASEGRDPFFPDSTRIFASNPKNQARGAAVTGLALKSILGASPRLFAIINNHTFAAGDEGDIITQSGQRLHIYCLEINPQAGTATVEADGVREVLHLSGGL